ncbi:thiopeptide-type bacteriocin biosynthesis protein [Micromonospora sp. HM134]|uniref:thiopeptide-type bacteriocin biosynthesis protein n=1 Tax=Micromonospora sp. HM134 TaxID=2583243 RepID=UPI00197C995E|nr:thiopeptide-type bacteriocin biosynthesis protein [Micromonospora sp. HM134]
MMPSPWLQITVELPDPDRAEHTAVTHLAPMLMQAEADRHITGWFFIRKTPQWRLRYLPTNETTTARKHLFSRLDALIQEGHITRAVEVVYEPETQAFGGDHAMAVAHRLWHADSRHLLSYLATTATEPTTRRRREIAILLASTLLRAAGLDWYEQGDVWSKVAHHRPPPDTPSPNKTLALQAALRRLMSTDASSLTHPAWPHLTAADWAAAFTTAGRDLAHLAGTGDLHRGLRDVLAHHVIFAMNRIGLPAATQAALATHAATAIFGPDPTTPPGTHHHNHGTTVTTAREETAN